MNILPRLETFLTKDRARIARKAYRERQRVRQQAILPLYRELGPHMPPVNAFFYFPSVTPFWHSDNGSPLDGWIAALPQIKREVAEHYQNVKHNL